MTAQDFIVQVKTNNGDQRTRDGRLVRDLPDKELLQKMLERYPGERENIDDLDSYLDEGELSEAPPKTATQEKLDEAKKSLFSRIGDRFKETEARGDEIDASGDSFASKLIQKAGAGASLLGGLAEEGIKSIPIVGDAYEATTEKIGEGLKKGVIDPLSETSLIKGAAEGYSAIDRGEAEAGFEQVAPEILRTAQGAGEVANLALGAKGAQQTVKAIDRAVPEIRQTVTKVADNIKANRLAKKDVEVDEAVGRILQGKPEDVETGRKALSNIDTKDVKTYEELNERIGENVESLSKRQDSHLEKFPEKYTPSTAAKYTRVGDELVAENPVGDALDGLESAYKLSGEQAKATAIRQLRTRFEKEGLTVKEINQLAKEYGIEYKDRAFDKMGNPKAGYNAESFENIRKGVKEVLRERMPDDVSRELDRQISDLYSTRDLTKKMEENVNKLYQKIKNRTLMQKAGGAIADVVDLASLGTLRGFIQKLLPSNVGLKTANSLDLEKELAKNLKKIEELARMKEGPEFDKAVGELLKSE